MLARPMLKRLEMKALAAIILIGFGLLWSSMTLMLDSKVFAGIAKQLRSRSTTPAQVLECKVTAKSGRRGSQNYEFKIRYRYTVDDKVFESDRYRYGSSFSSSDSRWAQVTAATHRVGSEIPAFYNPSDPTDVVLSAGLGGEDLFFLLFMTPFNMVMLGIAYATVVSLRNWLSPKPAGGVKILRRPPQLRVRLPKTSPWAALPLMTALAFLAIIPVAFIFGGHPPLGMMEMIWLFLFATGGAVFAQRWIRIRSGAEDLVIDEASSRISLPLTWGRKEPVTLPRSDLQAVTVESVVRTRNQGRCIYNFAPTLHFQGQHACEAKLAEWPDETRATAFVEWLRKQMNVGI